MNMQSEIEKKLQTDLDPVHIEVINETHMHNVPEDADSHFKVTVVSERFNDLPLIKQHRLVNAALSDELKQIHALALHTYTPDQWFERTGGVPQSPPCRGGSNI
ncbi:MAG TPA: BolA/IbaG family iron-sulfur metabolism protein [Chromatiales bacterium]|nr:BolA/IbaG family iron-sulfur metabolism protein [Thiotrichales bacterium]HIP67865.1 BolA/IbaG family iron-sulfur metabolism protein [Chromatiales bacterium]